MKNEINCLIINENTIWQVDAQTLLSKLKNVTTFAFITYEAFN